MERREKTGSEGERCKPYQKIIEMKVVIIATCTRNFLIPEL